MEPTTLKLRGPTSGMNKLPENRLPLNMQNLDTRITSVFISMGISITGKGCTYLRCAAAEAYNHPENAIYVTKTLYPAVARKCRAPSVRGLERTCHHAISRAFHGGYSHEFVKILGKAYIKCPTCSEFIRGVVSYLKEQDGADNL